MTEFADKSLIHFESLPIGFHTGVEPSKYYPHQQAACNLRQLEESNYPLGLAEFRLDLPNTE